MKSKFIVGTRGSKLALWQAEFVRSALEKRSPDLRFELRIIKTTGDRILDTSLSKIGDKGLFTKELETALLAGEIDLAVHSLKDLPTTQPDGLMIGAVTTREKPNDVLISKNADSIADLPPNARAGTGSLRRRSQLLHLRPDIEIVEMRGNVPTRIEKFIGSDLDAMILAYAGVHRLGLGRYVSQTIPTDEMLPAVGQGAVAVEIREGDDLVSGSLAAIEDSETRVCVTAERAFLRALEGGCQVPIGAYAIRVGGEIRLQGFVGSLDGKSVIREGITGNFDEPQALGSTLAANFLQLGAAEILDSGRASAKGTTAEAPL